MVEPMPIELQAGFRIEFPSGIEVGVANVRDSIVAA
jgi:hypothetical protein